MVIIYEMQVADASPFAQIVCVISLLAASSSTFISRHVATHVSAATGTIVILTAFTAAAAAAKCSCIDDVARR